MAKQDDYVRISIRIPQTLYNILVEAAGDRSLNAEVIERLRGSVAQTELFGGSKDADHTGGAQLSDLQELRKYSTILNDEFGKALRSAVNRMDTLIRDRLRDESSNK